MKNLHNFMQLGLTEHLFGSIIQAETKMTAVQGSWRSPVPAQVTHHLHNGLLRTAEISIPFFRLFGKFAYFGGACFPYRPPEIPCRQEPARYFCLHPLIRTNTRRRNPKCVKTIPNLYHIRIPKVSQKHTRGSHSPAGTSSPVCSCPCTTSQASGRPAPEEGNCNEESPH